MVAQYKGNSPLEKIEEIKNFFVNEKQFFLKQDNVFQNEFGFWESSFSLMKDGLLVYTAVGDGFTQEEAVLKNLECLYENFCNMVEQRSNQIFMQKFITDGIEKNGYVYDPKEKYIKYEDIMNVPTQKGFLLNLLRKEENIKKYLNIIFNETPIIGIPFQHISENKECFLNPVIIEKIDANKGCGTGYTLDEAVSSGIKSLMKERALIEFYTIEQEKYFAIKDENLQNQKIKDFFDILSLNDLDHYILDISDYSNLPAIILLVIDKRLNSIKISCGISSNMEDAIINAIYDLFPDLHLRRNYIPGLTIPFKETKPEILLAQQIYNINGCSYINENVFKKIEFIDEYGKIFCSKVNNELEFLSDVAKTNNIDFYYYNFGHLNNLYSVTVFSTNWSYNKQIVEKLLRTTSPLVLNDNLDYMHNLNAFVNKAIGYTPDQYEDLKALYTSITLFLSGESVNDIFYETLIANNIENIIGGYGFVILDFEMEYYTPDYIPGSEQLKSYLTPYVIQYQTLCRYANNKKYTPEEIAFMFNNVFKNQINEDTLLELPSHKFLLENCFCYPTKALYNSDTYRHIIHSHYKEV